MSILKFASLYIKSSISNIIPGLELRKKYCFVKKNFLVTSNLMYNDVAKNKPNHSTEICSFIVQPHLFNSRHIQTDIVCAGYCKVIIFRKKQFVKNKSFTNFWFVRSRNWFVIHELQTLNSISAYWETVTLISFDFWFFDHTFGCPKTNFEPLTTRQPL